MVVTLEALGSTTWVLLFSISKWSHLVKFLLGILLSAQLIFGSLPEPLQPLRLLFGSIDLVSELLLQVHLLHLHRAMLFLSDLQPEERQQRNDIKNKPRNGTTAINTNIRIHSTGEMRKLCVTIYSKFDELQTLFLQTTNMQS